MLLDIELPKNGFFISSTGQLLMGIARSCDQNFYNVEVYQHREQFDPKKSIKMVQIPKDGFKISVSCEGCRQGFCLG